VAASSTQRFWLSRLLQGRACSTRRLNVAPPILMALPVRSFRMRPRCTSGDTCRPAARQGISGPESGYLLKHLAALVTYEQSFRFWRHRQTQPVILHHTALRHDQAPSGPEHLRLVAHGRSRRRAAARARQQRGLAAGRARRRAPVRLQPGQRAAAWLRRTCAHERRRRHLLRGWPEPGQPLAC